MTQNLKTAFGLFAILSISTANAQDIKPYYPGQRGDQYWQVATRGYTKWEIKGWYKPNSGVLTVKEYNQVGGQYYLVGKFDLHLQSATHYPDGTLVFTGGNFRLVEQAHNLFLRFQRISPYEDSLGQRAITIDRSFVVTRCGATMAPPELPR